MRITVVMGFFLPVPALQGGSTEKIWLRLGEQMAAEGHPITVVSRTWPGLPDRESHGLLRHERCPGWDHTRSLWRNLWLDLRWGRRVRNRLPEGDVVVCNTVTLPIRLRRTRPSVGRVAVVLGRMPKGQVRAYGEVDLILATSEAVAERALLENPHVATKIVRFPNPIDWALHQRASRQTLAKAPFEIGYVGRIHPEKGLEQFLEAGCRLLPRTDLPAWRISLTGPVSVVQGGGGEAYRDGLLARYGGRLGDRLQIHAPVFNPVELARIYGGFEIFCYPSRAAKGEGLSIAPLEAMAAGAVPLVSQLACYRDVIVHDHNGLTFDQEGPDAAGRIAESIAGLLEDPGRRQRLSRTAQSDVRRYDYAEATRQLLQAFARLTGKSDKP